MVVSLSVCVCLLPRQERIRTNVRGRREEERVTLIGASTLGRIFERY